MNNSNQNLIIGALTADAATLGLHWIYDQQRIKDLTGKAPEFHPPTKSDYDGVPSFFAHGKKSVGDLSHYGEQAFVMLESLSSKAGLYNKEQYQATFREHFSYGGDYVGYIDRPTKDTLNNITISEHKVLKEANAIPFSSEEISEIKQSLITLVLNQLIQNANIEIDELKKSAHSELKQHIDTNSLLHLITCLQPHLQFHGADDVQLPAISKLPALVAVLVNQTRLEHDVESAVRVTNNNDIAADYGRIASKMMETAILTQNIESVIQAGRKAATPAIMPLIDNALNASNKTISEFTKEIGMSCNLEFGVPSVFHNLNQQLSFQESIRQNTLAGGDSCGRSILLGGILGAVHGIGTEQGIPTAWYEKLTKEQAITQLIKSL